MFELIEISRETYGHDHRAINRHQERRYRAPSGKLYVLSRTLDGQPPFFEAYGPFGTDHAGILPRLLVNGQTHWGDGWSWDRAHAEFLQAVTLSETRKGGDEDARKAN